jgi:hypothetical protein
MLAQAKSQSKVKLGENIITGGLGIQVLFFGLFIIVTGIFNYRIRAAPSLRSTQITLPWQNYLHVLYGASFLILVRSLFRIVEYAMGQDGVLLSHEYFLYIFDAALMFISMALFNIYHPSRIISHKTKDTVDHDPESQDSSYDLQEHRAHTNRRH